MSCNACRPRRLVAGLAVLAVLAGPAAPRAREGSQTGSPAPGAFTPIRAFLAKAVADGSTPSIAAGVIRNGVLVWSEAFGLADREKQIAATADTIYWLASVSKPLSATGLMQLVERGLVDLDRPANAYLGDARLRAYVGSADDMTVRRLANHTAGLPVHANFFHGLQPPPMDESIRRYGFASLEPGRHDGDIPLGVTVKSDGGIDVAFGSRGPEALKDPAITATTVSGRVDAVLHTQDSYRGVSDLRLTLSLRDGKLVGVCTASVPFYTTLPYWVELQRAGVP